MGKGSYLLSSSRVEGKKKSIPIYFHSHVRGGTEEKKGGEEGGTDLILSARKGKNPRDFFSSSQKGPTVLIPSCRKDECRWERKKEKKRKEALFSFTPRGKKRGKKGRNIHYLAYSITAGYRKKIPRIEHARRGGEGKETLLT